MDADGLAVHRTIGAPRGEVPQPVEEPTPIIPDAPTAPIDPEPATPGAPEEPSTVPPPSEPAEPVAPTGPEVEMPADRGAPQAVAAHASGRS